MKRNVPTGCCPISLAHLCLTGLSYASHSFDNLMTSHLRPPPQDLTSYAANYSDDSKTWRPVEVSRLVSKYQSEISDRKICASASAPKTCSIERILRKTGRFQKWLQAKRLTPDLVQVSVGLGRMRGGRRYPFIAHSSVVLNLWAATLLGIEWPFHRNHLKQSENPDIYIMLHTVAKLQL